MSTQDETTPAGADSFVNQVFDKISDIKDAAVDKLGDVVDAVRRESAEGGKIDVAKDKLVDFKDVAAGKIGEAVETVKRESAEGGKIDVVKNKVVGTLGDVKDAVATKVGEVRGKGETKPAEPAADETPNA